MKGGGESSQKALSEGDIHRIVLALRDVDQESAWGRVLEVGRLVFENIVAGDEAAWRSRRGQKDVSLRKLVQHHSCPYKKSALCSAVNVHLFVRAHPQTRRMPGITPTHVVQIFGLKAPDALDLLARAAAVGWSARDLGRQVRVLRKADGERRGRPAAARSAKAETMARRAVKDLQAMREALSSCDAIDDESWKRLHVLLDDISGLVAGAFTTPVISRRPSMVLPISTTSEPEAPPTMRARAS
jgi:hypothetical protein